jgi:hypothetical protein
MALKLKQQRYCFDGIATRRQLMIGLWDYKMNRSETTLDAHALDVQLAKEV